MAQGEVIRDWNDLLCHFTGEFRCVPHYGPETDTFEIFTSDEESWGEPLDARLTVRRSFRTKAVTGCHLGAVRRRLLPIVRTLALDDGHDEVTVKALLLAAIIAAADEGGPAQVNGRGYLEALAPICRTAGGLKVEIVVPASD